MKIYGNFSIHDAQECWFVHQRFKTKHCTTVAKCSGIFLGHDCVIFLFWNVIGFSKITRLETTFLENFEILFPRYFDNPTLQLPPQHPFST